MNPLDYLLHVDKHLQTLISQLGAWSYIFLFLIIFIETGLIIMPFLPGDSLLFAAGALAGAGLLEIWIIMPLLLAAAIIGDSVNYWVGHKLGTRAFSRENSRIFKPEYLRQTEDFYAKHGGKTIILARFVPIVRTFAPFVAGVGGMRYATFFAYNVIGGVVWVVGLTALGFFFGQMPFIKENFELAIITVVILSLLPVAFEFLRHKRNSKKAAGLDPASLKRDLEETMEKEGLAE